MPAGLNQGIILAAGDGDRLGPLTASCPKVLLPIRSKPLISYPIEALAAAGIGEIAVVVGYLGDQVKEALGNGSNFGVRLEYIFNPDYLSGNAISLDKAGDWAQGEPVALCMGDHLIEKTLVKRLLARATLSETLAVDYKPAAHHKLEEATKVSVDGDGYIFDIGKELVSWDGLDTGVFLLTGNFFLGLDELIKHGEIEISNVIHCLIRRGQRFATCDVSGCFWLDVDTEADLRLAG